MTQIARISRSCAALAAVLALASACSGTADEYFPGEPEASVPLEGIEAVRPEAERSVDGAAGKEYSETPEERQGTASIGVSQQALSAGGYSCSGAYARRVVGNNCPARYTQSGCESEPGCSWRSSGGGCTGFAQPPPPVFVYRCTYYNGRLYCGYEWQQPPTPVCSRLSTYQCWNTPGCYVVLPRSECYSNPVTTYHSCEPLGETECRSTSGCDWTIDCPPGQIDCGDWCADRDPGSDPWDDPWATGGECY